MLKVIRALAVLSILALAAKETRAQVTPNYGSKPNPLLFYDDFSGTALTALNGRTPLKGASTWISNGVGAAQATAGAGVLGSTGGNTYYVATAASNPYEIVTTFYNNSVAPSFATISVVKDWAGHPLDGMWHVNFSNGGTLIVASFWNNTWNGGASGAQVNVAPVYQFSTTCPTLAANTVYTARLILSPPFSDASLEDSTGKVLCASRAYDPIISTLMGPTFYVQTSDANSFYTSIRASTVPLATTANYARYVTGIEGTPIGRLQPAAANFSQLFVGPSNTQQNTQIELVAADGAQASQIPTIGSVIGASTLIIKPRAAGNQGCLSVQNASGGNGGTTTACTDSGFIFHLKHNNVDFVTHATTGTAQFIGMLKGSDAAPGLTSCGTSPVVAGTSTGGTVTEGSAASGCTITFANAPTQCNVTSQGGLVFTYSLTGAVLTIVNVGALSSTKINYTCTI